VRADLGIIGGGGPERQCRGEDRHGNADRDRLVERRQQAAA
jgi:hypothetical protein